MSTVISVFECKTANGPGEVMHLRGVVRTSQLVALIFLLCGGASAGYVLFLALNKQEFAMGRAYALMAATRWGWWLSMPAAAWMAGLCLSSAAIVWLTRYLKPATEDIAQVASIIGLAGSAGWFIALFAFGVVRAPLWLFVSVACSLLGARVLLYQYRVRANGGHSKSRLLWGAVGGIVIVFLLIAGQIAGPRVARADEIARQLVAQTRMDSGPGQERVVWPAGGRAPLAVINHPVIGSIQAPHLITASIDYTDSDTLRLHAALLKLRRVYGSDVSILPLICPPHVSCDSDEQDPVALHPEACELARLAVAVWIADHDSFEVFHEFLTNRDDEHKPRTVAAARQKAASLVGEIDLSRSLCSEYIEFLFREALTKHPPFPADLNIPYDRTHSTFRSMTCWAGGGGVPGAIIWGPETFDGLAHALERSTGILPLERAEAGHTELLEKLAR